MSFEPSTLPYPVDARVTTTHPDPCHNRIVSFFIHPFLFNKRASNPDRASFKVSNDCLHDRQPHLSGSIKRSQGETLTDYRATTSQPAIPTTITPPAQSNS